MSGDWLQISALVSCACVALGYIIRLIVVVWSLRADDKGREHAIMLLLVLRGNVLSAYRPRRCPEPPKMGLCAPLARSPDWR
jgi:hypothetical protein